MPNQPGWNQQWGQGQPTQGWHPAPQPPKNKRPKWPFIVVPLVGLFLVWLVIRLSFELTREDPEPVLAQPGPPISFPESTSETTPPPPGAPVVCDPRFSYRCFPDDYNPDAVMDALAAEGWTCWREGERDDIGNPVSEPRRCKIYDNVGQPYGIRASVTYERDFPDRSDGRLHAFTLKVNTAAALKRGEHTSPEHPTPELFKVFDLVSKHIWQGKPDTLEEVTETFEGFKPQCDTPEGRGMKGLSVTTPSGYELTCSGSGGVAVGDEGQGFDHSLKINPSNK